MTASGCQTITPPASLSSQWSSWTSAVDAWMDTHSSEYTRYLSRCEPWELAASLQCPTETTPVDTPVNETTTRSRDPTKTSSETAADSVTVITSTATATAGPTYDNTPQVSTMLPSATLISSGAVGFFAMDWVTATGAALLLVLTVI
ncbi:hypothetical protein SPBR_03546 [Sporothrix brasiliensis 5110]|uniref:Uncharacterized protein n=1 Tax=Sporothrix brasiliensis 5110 TaxID=1398154 RepID=A0A0C2J858_9PEZI|nr:uncharacterized protein SPBR_03546 [Sporothrix brasiliensis 5110]KIH95175.1 hypothetical protein SPBR_03546 [Sporothrix brasiliensis 5110]